MSLHMFLTPMLISLLSMYLNYIIYKFTLRNSVLIGLISGVIYFGIKIMVNSNGFSWKEVFSVIGVVAVYSVLRLATPDLFQKRQ